MKYSYEEIKSMFDERGYELVTTKEELDGMAVTDKIKYICPKHRDCGILSITYHHLKRNRGCKYCGREKAAEKRTKPLDEFRAKAKDCLESKGLEFVNVFRSKDTNGRAVIMVEFICPKHRKYGIQTTKYGNLMFRETNGCKYCIGKDIPKEEIFKQIQDILPHIEIISEFNGVSKPIKYRCNIHNYEGWSTCQNLLAGRACYYCGLEKLRKHNTLSQDEFVERVCKINKDIGIIGEYRGFDYPVKVHCNRCGNTWDAPVYSLYRREHGCPVCNMYTGEGVIYELLTQWGYNFDTQHRFKDCVDKKPLPFDFYLEDYNIAIEFDGILHYIPKILKRGMTQETADYSHKKTLEHDFIKESYCADNGIKLIRVPYWEYDEGNVPYYLFDHLVEYGAMELIT